MPFELMNVAIIIIISNTSFKNMQYRRSHDETIEHYHDANVYFQDEDMHTYIIII